MKNTLLFSDVHLKAGDHSSDAFRSFQAFLHGIDPEETERIICLGDLFDFWCEYRHVMISGYFPTLRAFAQLHEAGIALHLVCGNHDFWAGASLETYAGFQVHREPVRLPFGAQEALLLHGDGLNPRDYGYLLFRRVVRSSLITEIFRRLHPDTAMTIARMLSHGSRTLLSSEKPAEGAEARFVRAHALRLLHEGAAPIVICGHAHVPVIEETQTGETTGRYINPGDWPHHRSYAIFDGQDFHLRRFGQ